MPSPTTAHAGLSVQPSLSNYFHTEQICCAHQAWQPCTNTSNPPAQPCQCVPCTSPHFPRDRPASQPWNFIYDIPTTTHPPKPLSGLESSSLSLTIHQNPSQLLIHSKKKKKIQPKSYLYLYPTSSLNLSEHSSPQEPISLEFLPQGLNPSPNTEHMLLCIVRYVFSWVRLVPAATLEATKAALSLSVLHTSPTHIFLNCLKPQRYRRAC